MSWAVILGASSGVGESIARCLAEKAEHDIFGVHRGNWPGQARPLRASIEAAGRRAEMFVTDAASEAAAEEGAQRLLAVAGTQSVSVFVHSIASASVGPLVTGNNLVHSAQIESTFTRMAHSFLYWVRALHRHRLLAPDATIIGLTNLMPEHVIRNAGLIAASKAALEQYVRHLAYELGPEGIRVCLLRFGLVVTPAVRRSFSESVLSTLEETMRSNTVSKQLCSPDEVAECVRFLASSSGRFFHGATLDFSGAESHAFFDRLVYGERDSSANRKPSDALGNEGQADPMYVRDALMPPKSSP